MQASELIEIIEESFDCIQRPDTSLQQFKLTDTKGMSEGITDYEWSTARENRIDFKWQDIPDSEIEECGCILAHMGIDELLYYLPAYMRYAINHIDEPVWENDVIGGVVFSLHPPHVPLSEKVSEKQRKAIINFLSFIEENADHVERPDAKKARERYWERNYGS